MFSKKDITYAKWGEVCKMPHYHLAILPWGATEPHNRHLPYCTDMLTAQAISCKVAEAAQESGVGAMVLPAIPLGSQNPGQVELPYCIHASVQTQLFILKDIVKSLKRQGINKLMIISGHGGNNFKGMIRDLMIDDPSFLICYNEWFSILKHSDYFEAKEDDHAGELETSVMLYLLPDTVRMSLAGNGESSPFAIDGLNNKIAWLPRDWSKVSTDTGIGNPKKASVEKGKKYIQDLIPIITSFVVDFALKPVYNK